MGGKNTKLMEAGKIGNIEEVRALIQKGGCNVNCRDDRGHSVLSRAAEYGHADIVKILLDAGADSSSKDKYSDISMTGGQAGDTALIHAAKKGHVGVLRVLLNADLNVNSTNKNGDTALDRAASVGNVEIVKILLEAGADIHASKNKNKKNALTHACEGGSKAHEEIVKMLKDKELEKKRHIQSSISQPTVVSTEKSPTRRPSL
jgi:uncharacterized protein